MKLTKIILSVGIVVLLGSCSSYKELNKGKKFAEIVWSKKIGVAMFSSPALDADGNLYIGTRGKGVYSFTSEGEIRWVFAQENHLNFDASPVLSEDGTIYIGSDQGKLFAITPEGNEKWNFATSGLIFSSPAIGSDGTIYIASDDERIYAVNPQGEMLWFFNTGGSILSSPIIGKDGIIYVGSNDQVFYAINPDGTVKWKFKTKGHFYSQAAISPDNTIIYIASFDNKLYALDIETAQLKWFLDMEAPLYASIVLSSEGYVYMTREYMLYAIDSEGNVMWEARLPGEAFATPVVGDDGTIYVPVVNSSSASSYMVILNNTGKLIWQRKFTRDLRSSPTIGKDGTVYFGSNIGYLYAMKGKSNAPASHDWAMFRGNIRHTGRAQ